MTDHVTKLTCRVCGSGQLDVVLDLGATPLANALVLPERAASVETRYPLAAARCPRCGMVQLTIVVDPAVMFASYLYASSASAPLLSHFDQYAGEVAERFAPPGSFVAEIGSNDGVLLRPLAKRGVEVLGIEPARNIAATANASGLRTWNEFFSADVARRARAELGPAKAVLANNVLAHIDDLSDVLAGLDVLLDADGAFVAEFPYLGDLIEHVEYDTIYHEHLSYFSLAPLDQLFDRIGMELFDAHHLAIHGGSLRIFAGRRGAHPKTIELAGLRESESRAGLAELATYRAFAERVVASRTALRDLIRREQQAGRRIAGLGATAKGSTLLNYCALGPAEIAYIGDSTQLKQGLLTPGMHIPVVPEERLKADRPDRILLLAWNYADAIVPRYRDYLESGGRFIHPIPLARLIGP